MDGSASAVSYGVTLLPGDYIVWHAANDYLCTYTTLPGIPCNDQIVAGCP